METANEIVTEYAIQFVKDHWEEILNYRCFESLGITSELSKFIEELKTNINTVGWIITEVMN